jgi:CDP-4-dehydro-6-deoxyglucose reductase
LICTGTGVAPFRSMLIDIQKNKKQHKNIHLIFGTRNESGILYREEFEKLEKEMPGFKYTITLSRDENWKGLKGYVHQVYLEEYKNVRPDVDFYICGWSNMIDDAVANLLLKLKYDKSQIHYELYG